MKLLEWNALTDSSEMLEARTPAAIRWFLFILPISIAAALVWSWYAQMDVVVKTQGVIKTNEQVAKIIHPSSGILEQVFIQQGQQVKAGDKLYVVNAEALKQDLERLKLDDTETSEKLTWLIELNSDLVENGGLPNLSKDDLNHPASSERDKFYYAFAKVMNDRAFLLEQINNKEKLEESLLRDQNLLDARSEEYDRYETYRLKKAQTVLTLEQLRESYKQAVFLTEETQSNEFREQIKVMELKLQSEENEFRYIVRSDLDLARQKKRELDKQQSDLMIELQSAINSLTLVKKETGRQMKDVQSQLNKRVIRAPQSGIVHMQSEIGPEQYVQEGVQLMTIVPETKFRMQLFFSQQDIGRVKEGEEIRLRLASYPQDEYGTVEGELNLLSSDATIDPQSGVSYFMAEASLKSGELVGPNGRRALLRAGMQGEAFVITEEKSVLRWLAEKLDFISLEKK
ncbi:type I secretion membrane fusion protein, HlyD family [Paenibacillaceae bacterium GAS479]|nr:type I secretion membrane fusion protein, HlyD family [Paenibacillaceae bacterium GAS479]